jgi:hypothetical protein
MISLGMKIVLLSILIHKTRYLPTLRRQHDLTNTSIALPTNLEIAS